MTNLNKAATLSNIDNVSLNKITFVDSILMAVLNDFVPQIALLAELLVNLLESD